MRLQWRSYSDLTYEAIMEEVVEDCNDGGRSSSWRWLSFRKMIAYCWWVNGDGVDLVVIVVSI